MKNLHNLSDCSIKPVIHNLFPNCACLHFVPSLSPLSNSFSCWFLFSTFISFDLFLNCACWNFVPSLSPLSNSFYCLVFVFTIHLICAMAYSCDLCNETFFEHSEMIDHKNRGSLEETLP